MSWFDCGRKAKASLKHIVYVFGPHGKKETEEPLYIYIYIYIYIYRHTHRVRILIKSDTIIIQKQDLFAIVKSVTIKGQYYYS